MCFVSIVAEQLCRKPGAPDRIRLRSPGHLARSGRGRDGLPVLFDSGIRSGADIVKALALGAAAVGIGRPYAYGLALGGLDGSVHVLRMLLAEADLTMAVDGYPTLKAAVAASSSAAFSTEFLSSNTLRHRAVGDAGSAC